MGIEIAYKTQLPWVQKIRIRFNYHLLNKWNNTDNTRLLMEKISKTVPKVEDYRLLTGNQKEIEAA